VVNDGSTDKGSDIVDCLLDSRIILINKENEGVSSARNFGISQSKFDYIAFLDADDYWLPNHLNVINTLIQKYGDKAEVYVTNFARKYSNGYIKANRSKKELASGLIGNYFRLSFKKVIIHTSCVCVKKSVFDTVKGFDVRFTNGEDIDLWMRIAKNSFIAYSNEVTEIYRIDADNNSSKQISSKRTFAKYVSFADVQSIYELLIKLRIKIKYNIKLMLNNYE
jgi:glycosyltransferase involved in cell wall biosynthesis